MSIRRWHRLLGIALLLPMAGWAATALVFFLKPGYEAAYAPLEVRALADPAAPEALETRRLRTVLGEHLLVRTAGGWRQEAPMPEDPDVRRLIDDTLSSGTEAERTRYGAVASLRREGSTAVVVTTTGVTVTLDWDSMTLSQRGSDTEWIDRLYRIHYLQWTGVGVLDRALGLAGIGALALLTILGARLARGGTAS